MDLNDTPGAGRVPRRRCAPGSRSTRRRRPRRAARAPAPRTTRTSTRAARWQGQLAEGGLAGVTWPAEYGGQGLGPDRAGHRQPGDRARRRARASSTSSASACSARRSSPTAPRSRRQRYLGADAPRRRGVVPALLRAGRRLRPRRRPDARAPARTTARWVLNGQKVWTTNAQFAAFGLLLARTDPDVPKHKGLTMFIVPMDAEGVTVRGAAPDLRRGRVQRGLLRRRRASTADARRRPGQRRLGHGADDADVRARDDRPGLARAWATGPTASRARSPPTTTRRRDPEVRKRLGEIATELLALRFTGYRTLTALGAGPDPRPRGRPGQGHDGQRGDRRRRADRRRARPRRARRGRPVGLHDLVPARPEVRGRHRGDPAQHDRRARARPAARAAAGQGHARSASCAPRRRRRRPHEPRALRRAGVPARGRARRAVARQDRRGRPRGARGRRAARPVADRASRPAGPGC